MKVIKQSAQAAARRLWITRNQHLFVDSGPARKPRLYVDVSVISRHDAATGIQRVVRSIWSHLRALESSEFDVVPVYAGQTHGYCIGATDLRAWRMKGAPRIPVGARAGDKFLGLDLSAHYFPYFYDQVQAWRSVGASIHMVVYDLLPLLRPRWFEPATATHFAAWFDALSELADQILCISDQVSKDVELLLDERSSGARHSIGRLYLSGDIEGSVPSRGLSAEVEATLAIAAGKPVILMVGTVEPRKGYDRALDAFEWLWQNYDAAPSLVIIGKAGWKTAALQERLRTHPEAGRRLYWLERVSDEALTRFYEVSTAVFSASYAEGFGLPVAEAAMHKKWVLARDLPVFREHSPLNVQYFADDSPQALAGRLMDLIRFALGSEPPPTEQPSWSCCVERLLEELGTNLSEHRAASIARVETPVIASCR